jgi:hypothetical protein
MNKYIKVYIFNTIATRRQCSLEAERPDFTISFPSIFWCLSCAGLNQSKREKFLNEDNIQTCATKITHTKFHLHLSIVFIPFETKRQVRLFPTFLNQRDRKLHDYFPPLRECFGAV